MRHINALVTGIGTIIGYGIIDSLRKSNYDVRIIGMDINPEAVGKNWCDEFVVAEPAISNNYINFLKNIIDLYNIDIVFLGIEQEMNRINKSRRELGDYLKKIVINTEDVIEITGDKWNTYNFLKENEMSVIPSTLQNDYDALVEYFDGKFIVKPRCSYSSRGIGIIENKITFDYYKYLLGNELMAQKIVGDNEHEYTVASFGFGDGDTTNPIIFKRKLSFEGSTLKAEVVDNDKIEKSVYKLSKILKPLGPTNYQYRIDGEDVFLLEINPRVSSSTSLRTAFGYNEAEIAIKFFVENEKNKFINIKKGKAVRYIADYIEYV